MPNDLHVHFRLPPAYARKLRALAEANNTSPSLAARHALIDALDDNHAQELLDQIASLHEELAASKAAQKQLHDDLNAFRSEFREALKAAQGEARDGRDHRPAHRG